MEIRKEMQFSGKVLGGIILIFFGFVLLEDTIGIDITDQLLPILLIGFGIYLMVRRRNLDMKTNANAQADKFDQTMDNVYTKVNDFEAKVDETLNKTDSSIDKTINKIDEKIDKFNEHINKFDQKITDFEKGLGEGFVDSEQNSTHEKFKDPNFKQKFKSEFSGAFNRNGKVKYEKAFGDLFVNCKGINVENVEVSSAIGDIELQMREALFTDGLNRLIISNFIGNVNIYLPKDLAIFVNCSNFIGDIEAAGKRSTGFGNKVESQSTDYDTATKKLYIACNSFIGDITIISV